MVNAINESKLASVRESRGGRSVEGLIEGERRDSKYKCEVNKLKERLETTTTRKIKGVDFVQRRFALISEDERESLGPAYQ
jgi:hypothetical protein